MIKVYQNSKVYVYAPAKVTTGGAELLHQLVHVLNSNNIEAFIVYFDNADKNWTVSSDVPKEYENYNLKIADRINDEKENIVVIYEGIFNHIYDIKKAQLILWWLSVDNFYICSANFLSVRDSFRWSTSFGVNVTLRKIYNAFTNRSLLKQRISLKRLAQISALHCYQSEYAQNFLLNNNFQELLPLSDFINTEFINNNYIINEKENKILYNPKKGYKFTKKLIAAAPELNWKPLVGFTRKELINELRTAKLYIDFGYHPGKDRIPREAVSSGCCIITNKAGSAKFFEDVPIFSQYKIENPKKNILDILNQIKNIFNNYDDVKSDFDFYRNQIKKEKIVFEEQVMNIFKFNRKIN